MSWSSSLSVWRLEDASVSPGRSGADSLEMCAVRSSFALMSLVLHVSSSISCGSDYDCVSSSCVVWHPTKCGDDCLPNSVLSPKIHPGSDESGGMPVCGAVLH